MKIGDYRHSQELNPSRNIDPFMDPFFERVGYYREQLLNKEALMEYLAILASKTIKKVGWKCEEFELNNMYAILFMGGDMEQLMSSCDEEYGLVFQRVSEEHILCVAAFASMNEDEEIEVYTDVYELPDYQKGNREWLLLGQDEKGKLSGEVEKAGEDVFELECILRNADTEWIAAREAGIE